MSDFSSFDWYADHIALNILEFGGSTDSLVCSNLKSIKATANFHDTMDLPEDLRPIANSLTLLRKKNDLAGAITKLGQAADNKKPWIAALASLHLGRLLAKSGLLKSAADWVALSIAIFRKFELHTKCAISIQLRGEIYFQSGLLNHAFDDFNLSYELLPSGHPQRGICMCFQALCLKNMGTLMHASSEMIWRLAANYNNCNDLKGFAWSGLALLAAETGRIDLVHHSVRQANVANYPDNRFRLAVAKSRIALNEHDLILAVDEVLQAAISTHSPIKKQWARQYAESLINKCSTQHSAISSPLLLDKIPCPRFFSHWKHVTAFDFPEYSATLQDNHINNLIAPLTTKLVWDGKFIALL